MVRVKLTDGTEVLFEMSWGDWRSAFDRALAKGHALDVHGANGKIWAINPNVVSYFEVVDPSAAAATNGDGDSLAASEDQSAAARA